MTRVGDQSLGVPNGEGDMSTALAHALELENNGIIPYTVDENGFFSSNRMYPRIRIFTKDAMIPVAGDTLLEVTGIEETPILKYFINNRPHNIVGNNNITYPFDGGQPITGQSHQPIIDNIERCKGVLATFEIYGPKYRKILIDYRDSIKKTDGFKLKNSKMNKEYQIYGCSNSGFMFENNISTI
jgi:hypothetical protein